MSSHCFNCGDRVDSDAKSMGGAHLCRSCVDGIEAGGDSSTDTDDEPDAPGGDRVLDALDDAVAFFHDRLDDKIVTGSGEITTPRDYFADDRGWSDETIAEKRLGWAPADETALYDHLIEQGYDRDTILGTGLFYDSERDDEPLYPHFRGRFVFPYFDEDGTAVYAISRSLNADADGHPDDHHGGQKYTKAVKDKPYSEVDEPIYGLESLEAGQPAIITEGIADAITAHQAGIPCISPVTRQFKNKHRPLLRDVLADHGVERVFIVNDAEYPGSDLTADRDGWDALTVSRVGEGLSGALDTAAFLDTEGFDARVGDLPQPSAGKVDFDDYLIRWDGDLRPIVAGAVPPTEHPAYDSEARREAALEAARDDADPEPTTGDGERSGLFDLDITDVARVSTGYRGTNPLGHHGDSENYYVVVGDRDPVGYDHKWDVAYNALTHLLVEAGERRAEAPHGPLDDGEYLAAWVEAKQQGILAADDPIPTRALIHVALTEGYCDRDEIDDGWKIPSDAYNAALEYVRDEIGVDPGRDVLDGTGSADHVAVLPDSPSHRAIVNGWDWRTADRDGGLTKADARQRTTDAIATAYEHANDVLIGALPSMGKSFGAIRAAAETGEQITIATLRGHKEMYDQYREWADEHGLTALVLPSINDCPTYPGDDEPESEWERRFERWYANGATPKGMHVIGADLEGEKPPCEHGEERCPCLAKWDFDPDDYDVLIGHYNHLHNLNVVKGRTVAVDEFPASSFETTLGERLPSVVSTFLETRPGIPFDNYTDLIENRDDDRRRAEALLWFEDNGVEPDELEAFTDGGHAMAPVATFALLAGNDLGNGYERARLGDGYSGGVAVHNQSEGCVSMLRPPEPLEYARNVVALDGTPTPIMWRYAIGRRLDHRPVLDDENERREYIREALNLNIVRTTDAAKSYAAGESEIDSRVTVDEDRALLEAIADRYDEKPGVISTKRANRVYDDHGVLDHAARVEHYGNLKGSNHFGATQLGVVLGSQNYGPAFVEKWGAYMGEAIEPKFPGEDFDLEAGARTDYGPTGNKIRRHMTEHQTLQAVMRFGRSDTVDGAVVYCHTDTLPEWVPIADEARVLSTWSDGMKQVLDAVDGRGSWTTAEIADAVEISERQVRTHLQRLVDQGVVSAEIVGNGYVWEDDGLHRVDEHGDVDLEPVELDALDDDESAEVARMSTYRWDFRTSTPDSSTDPAGDDQPAIGTPDRPATADGPPPGPGN